MGGETKIFKRGQTESRDECLKRGGTGTPLRTMGFSSREQNEANPK